MATTCQIRRTREPGRAPLTWTGLFKCHAASLRHVIEGGPGEMLRKFVPVIPARPGAGRGSPNHNLPSPDGHEQADSNGKNRGTDRAYWQRADLRVTGQR
jgi:hypothetical protein